MAYCVIKTPLTLIDHTKIDVQLERLFSHLSCKEEQVVFRKGHHYTLQEKACEDFEAPISEYEFVHELNNFGGVEINGVIMKYVDGPEKQFHTLTRNDCESIGIPYEPRLELFSKTLKWQKKKMVYKPFNVQDLSSVPLCERTGLIHYFVMEIQGIKPFETSDELFVLENRVFSIKSTSPFKLVAKRTLQTSDGRIIVPRGGVFYEQHMRVAHRQTKDGNKTIYSILFVIQLLADSTHSGIDPKMVEGLSINDVVSVEIDTNVAIPVDAYIEKVRNAKFNIAQIDQAQERIRPNIQLYDTHHLRGRAEYIQAMEEYYNLLHRMVYAKSHLSFDDELQQKRIQLQFEPTWSQSSTTKRVVFSRGK